jgi:hypothetical protein
LGSVEIARNGEKFLDLFELQQSSGRLLVLMRFRFVPHTIKNALVVRCYSVTREQSAEDESFSCFARSFQYQSNRLR